MWTPTTAPPERDDSRPSAGSQPIAWRARGSSRRNTERRAEERQTVQGSILIAPGHEGALLDVSVRGFAVESGASVRVGALYRLRWRTAGCVRPVSAVARWSRLAATEKQADGEIAPRFRTGFEIARPVSVKPAAVRPG